MKINTINYYIKLIQNNLTDDLRKKKYQGHKNKYYGHCYVASEALYHLLKDEYNLKPMIIKHEGNDTHWFLLDKESGRIIDATVKQFKTKPDYLKARGIGFLTKQPSKRTKILLSRLLNFKN